MSCSSCGIDKHMVDQLRADLAAEKEARKAERELRVQWQRDYEAAQRRLGEAERLLLGCRDWYCGTDEDTGDDRRELIDAFLAPSTSPPFPGLTGEVPDMPPEVEAAPQCTSPSCYHAGVDHKHVPAAPEPAPASAVDALLRSQKLMDADVRAAVYENPSALYVDAPAPASAQGTTEPFMTLILYSDGKTVHGTINGQPAGPWALELLGMRQVPTSPQPAPVERHEFEQIPDAGQGMGNLCRVCGQPRSAAVHGGGGK